MTPRRSSHIRLFHATRTTPSTSAEPLYVLLHGVGLSRRSFSRLARALAGSGHMVGADFAGFGGGA
jgi:predicted dienelactone hydrolase